MRFNVIRDVAGGGLDRDVVAGRVGADMFALGAAGPQVRADGGTIPPGEDFCEDSHEPSA